jgi:hypothetical protein
LKGVGKLRIIWFWFALVVAGAAGYFAYDALPGLIGWLTDAPLSAGYLSVLNNSLTVALSGRIALAVIIFTLLGLVIPAILQAIALDRAVLKIKSFPANTASKSTMLALEFEAELSDFRLLEKAIPAYARFLIEQDDTTILKKRQARPSSKLKALVPAGSFFGPAIFVDEHLLGWLFRPLSSFLLGSGFILFIITCLIGFHDYREALPLDPLGGAGILWSWVEKGLFSLCFAATGAMITLIITRMTFGLHSLQVRNFCRFLDAKFSFSPPSAALNEGASSSERENQKIQDQLQKLSFDLNRGTDAGQQELAKKLTQAFESLEFKLTRSIEASLRPPLEKLTEVSAQVSGKQSEITAQVIKSALDAFIRNLEKEIGGQFRKTNTLLKSTLSLSAKVEKGFIGSLKDLAKHNDQQASSASAVSKEINATLNSLKGFEKTLEKAINSIQPTLDRVLANQAALLKALTDEKTGSKDIKEAAGEMSKAAKASKDTVESFITLAEKLKEASRAMGASGKAVPPAAARQTAGDDGPAQGTTLGRALRGLRDKAESTGKLPKL